MAGYTNPIHIAIDADSLIYKSCYRHQTPIGCDLEQAYGEFHYEIGKIKSAVFRLLPYKSGDYVKPHIILSPEKSFRNELSKDYKANRIDKQSIHGIKALKNMVLQRLPNAKLFKNIEADDVCIFLSKTKNWLISAIDKDVINASYTSCYNYNRRNWVNPKMDWQIEEWYVKQALLGDDADNIKGAKGFGEKRAEEFVEKYRGDMFSWNDFVECFGDEHIAKQTMNLVRMDRLVQKDKKLIWKPWDPFKEENIFWEY